MRELLYDVEWQVIRMTSCQRYHYAGGWATAEGTADNLWRLGNYLNAAKTPQEAEVRKFRANQYLVWIETLLTRHQAYRQLDLVRTARKRYRDYDVSEVRRASMSWSWSKVVLDLVRLRNKDEEVYTTLFTYLSRRNRRGKGHQEELGQFLMIMERFLWQ